ncbi:N-6 DNA Methylase family [Coleofasciculus chthonoplastes PCC 7420]|uniref:site-specific DNA-methyltransferase (adenine-specific) n=1 Tax=Coleofasciculus chthonoplastes PCC 7420 TaxID=118168 RepID=B4VWD9_9CYAN|nr:type ISP restriction/modification enzyme [Coleofasciculus chthonoplastes]EDX73788.1 N-6 DNA Methylase family [Coleofasciculus chthonoplastes PCC 7420]
MPSISFESYLKSIQKNRQKGSERSHYPALKTLLDDPANGIDAVIEEKGNKAGIPDFTVKRRDLLVGYVEAKDVGSDLNSIEKTEQLQRYLESFPNLVLTNYLEFRWYVNGKRRLKQVLADINDSRDAPWRVSTEKIAALLDQFLNYTGEIISNPEDLAQQMARLTKAIRLATLTALSQEGNKGELHQLKQGFSEVLLPQLTDPDFADMYAQTISYGLFAARVGHAQNPGSEGFTRRTAGTYIPATNPFLKRLFNTIVETDAVSQIDWAIDDLVQLLAQVDMSSILENFGQRTRQDDPVVHFYETFLAAYNKALRKSRGVYYTPEPVVSFIVRSVDAILKERFNLPLGLADNTKDPKTQKPRVQILDPATGTGTFLYEVIKQIYRNLEDIGMANQWDSYVEENLLNRLFGFELLMAPYAIAHLKLGLALQELGYQFKGKQRLGIYLTNTLDEALKKSEILFGQFVAQEANEASTVKQDTPVMVVLGNPPYSYESLNTGKWISGLVRDYYKVDNKDLREKNPKGLQDDYVKFIRFAQWRIETTGYGILAFITNHGYLKNSTFRGMRQNLMQTFDEIYILDLHGSSKPPEINPDGSKDENVFDIQPGVAIGFFVKKINLNNAKIADVYHADLWGVCEVIAKDNDKQKISGGKYYWLSINSIETVNWEAINPRSPEYRFVPMKVDSEAEYESEWKINEVMPVNSVGLYSARDDFAIHWEKNNVEKTLKDFINLEEESARKKYSLGNDSRDWKISLAQKDVWSSKLDVSRIHQISYRPFDTRFTYYTGTSRGLICMPRPEVMSHLLAGDNVAMCFIRNSREQVVSNFLVAQGLVDKTILSSADNAYVAPLYIYPDTQNNQGNLFVEKSPNLSSDFITEIREKLGYIPTPEAIFYYIYAIFHSPTYRQRYAEFLKIDFPRVPLTSNDKLFKDLGTKGQELVDLHLMKSKKLNNLITKIGGDGDNAVTEVTYKPKEQRVYINKTRYFEGIAPDVWEFKIGGYQVLSKWLKDRKKAKRTLSFDELLHYQKVVVALKETMQLMEEIDKLIPSFPLE